MYVSEKVKRIIASFLAFVMIFSMDSGAFAYAYQDYLYRETTDPSDVSVSAVIVDSESGAVKESLENGLTVIDTKTGDGYIDVTYSLETGNQSLDGIGVLLELPVFERKDGVLVQSTETYGDAYIKG